MPIIALPSTSPYYALKTVPLQRLLYQDYLDLDSTMHHKSHLLIYLFAIYLPLCSTTDNRCTEFWDADSSPSEGPIHPNLAFLCIPISVGLDCLHFLVFLVGCIPGAVLDMALEGCMALLMAHNLIEAFYTEGRVQGHLTLETCLGQMAGKSGFYFLWQWGQAEYFCAHTMVSGTCASHSIPNFILLSPLHGLSMTAT